MDVKKLSLCCARSELLNVRKVKAMQLPVRTGMPGSHKKSENGWLRRREDATRMQLCREVAGWGCFLDHERMRRSRGTRGARGTAALVSIWEALW